jgi:hypothetical protein
MLKGYLENKLSTQNLRAPMPTLTTHKYNKREIAPQKMLQELSKSQPHSCAASLLMAA